MSCACDQHHCRTPLSIAAGLSLLPRAPGGFAGWREELLAAAGREPALRAWRAREDEGLGLLLLEMAAYVLDVDSFYDQLVANESYLPTARLPGAQRRHVGLLGYRPRPAMGARAWVAAEAEGPRLVALPEGTAVRSGAFGAEAPQVFELDREAQIEPRLNRLEVARGSHQALASPLASLQVLAASLRAHTGDAVLLECAGSLCPGRLASTGTPWLRVPTAVRTLHFSTPLNPPAGATVAGSRLWVGGQRCGAWRLSPVGSEPAVVSGAEISLEGRVALHAGDLLMVDNGSTLVARRILQVAEAAYTVVPALTSTLTDSAQKSSTLVSPALQTRVTRLTLDSALPFGSSDIPHLVVHHSLVSAATLFAPPKDTLEQADPILLPGLQDAPRSPPQVLQLQDVHGQAVVTGAVIDAASRTATADTSPAWGQALWAPVTLFGNVLPFSRGETVRGERLGVGDASLPRQVFRLSKHPLSYLSAANAAGRRSTLQVHVAGVLWHEVESFHRVAEHAMVYMVEHDDEGHTDVIFGGGARLPTGVEVWADYRFGAGAAVPPAGSLKQLARPVQGVRSVRNGLPAYGGADAEGPAELAVRGPRSGLLIGRAISLADLEAAAADQGGVRNARAGWAWDERGLQPLARVSVCADAQVLPALTARLRALCEENVALRVVCAPAQTARLDLDLQIHPDHVPETVVAAVQQCLFEAATLPGSGGPLRPEKLGPDDVLFASPLIRAVMDVAGVQGLQSLRLDGSAFTETGRRPALGHWFDFETGGVWVNGRRAP